MVFARWLCLFGLTATLVTAQSPDKLKCEWQTEPIGIQTSAPRFNWIIKADFDGQRGISQTAYRVLVATDKRSLSRHMGNAWDSGRVNSAATYQITYTGKPLRSSTNYYWAVDSWDSSGHEHWSPEAAFHTALLEQKDWTAIWIMAAQSPEREPALPLFRREFRLTKPVARAIVYLSGLGQYELHLNGRPVSDAVLAPAWSDYRKTVFYNTFDVTADLRRGENVFGVMLGNGMYNVPQTKDRYEKFTGTFGPPKLLFQAVINFTDGTSTVIMSDHTWRTVQGPITFSNTYGGEDFDSRLEQPGWDNAGFKEKEWLEAQETEGPGGKLVSQQAPPVTVAQTLPSVKVTEPKPGTFVYDLGRNFAGWPEITVKGSRGSSVKLIAGELLDREGLASQRSSGGPQWFSFTLNGTGAQTWHPRFSYWGFRFVQVERQADGGVLPEITSVKGEVVHTSAALSGSFSSSSDLLNRTHQLIDEAIASNLQSIVTDCPHREKLGWLEQTHLMGSALIYNFDLATLYEKITGDMADEQTSDGLIPDIAPEYTVFENGFRDSPEWGSAFILDPWLAYRHYGDTRILAEHYDRMKRYAEYLAGKADGHIISYGLGDWFDIGPGEPGVSKLTSLGVTATATYYQDLVTLAACAKVLQKPADESHFRTEAAAVRQGFNAKYYTAETHVYDKGSQTDYAMALVTGLAPDEDRPAVLNKLIRDIRAHQDHITAGDIGFHYVVEALMDNGHSDVLYDMLSKTDAPSYGDQLKRGATTLTEAWDANPLDSQNHFMLGDAEEWFYQGLAGIDFDLSRPDGQRLLIRPAVVGDLASAEATYDSVLGRISSRWSKANGVITLTVEIPPNLTALVHVPAERASVDRMEGVSQIASAKGEVAYQVRSGHYVFRSLP